MLKTEDVTFLSWFVKHFAFFFTHPVLEHIQHEKELIFSEEKCELFKVNSKIIDATIQGKGKAIKTVRVVHHLGDNKDILKEPEKGQKDHN